MMKYFMVFVSIILIGSFSANGQNNLINFYPLNDNDYWEYTEEKIDPIWKEYQKKVFSIQVMGDTLMSNLKKYRILKKTWLSDSTQTESIFERIDSTSLNIYRYNIEHLAFENNEILIDSLKTSLHDRFYGFSRLTSLFSYLTFVSNSEDIFWGNFYILKTFRASDIIWDYQYTLAENIGLMTAEAISPEVTFYYKWELKYAKIKGKEYNFETKLTEPQFEKVNFKLEQNYPNPFNNSTIIPYYLEKSDFIEINLINTIGQQIELIFKGFKYSGFHRAILDGGNISSGVYLIQLKTSEGSQIKRCLYLK